MFTLSRAVFSLRSRCWRFELVGRSLRWATSRHPQPCAICGTSISDGDTISLSSGGVAHGECAVVHALEAGGSSSSEEGHGEAARVIHLTAEHFRRRRAAWVSSSFRESAGVHHPSR